MAHVLSLLYTPAMSILIRRKRSGEPWETAAEDAAGGSQTVLVATKHLTTADILTLGTVPVTIVAAQGAGKIIVPLRGFIQLNAGATPFDNLDNGLVDLNAAGTDTAAGFANTNYGIGFTGDGLISATDVAWSSREQGGDIFPINQATLANKALTLLSERSNPSQGNGSADVTVLYYVVDLA